MTIGVLDEVGRSNDTELLDGSAGVYVDPHTNERYVADAEPGRRWQKFNVTGTEPGGS